jgi:Flp pilus assembly protein protease CpaA
MVWCGIPAAVWVITCMRYDCCHRRIPNLLAFSGWFGATTLVGVRIFMDDGQTALHWLITLSIWSLSIAFWFLGWWGAGDAKFVMALALAFPDLWMLLAMFLVNLALGGCASVIVAVNGMHTPEQKTLPAVGLLGLGWLVWAALILVKG